MTPEQLELLFDEFAVRHVRGERPDVREYLERAGAEREVLGRMLDRFLQAAPAWEPAEEDVVLMEARLEQEPPLLLLRRRRKLARRAVVDALVRALGLDPAKSDKVDGYYHRLETGLLDPEPVSSRVWDVLAELLRANVRAMATLRLGPPTGEVALRRATEPSLYQAKLEMLDADAPLAVPPVPLDEGPDEVDMLFTAGE